MAVTAEGKEYARKIANDESPEVAIRVFNEVMDVLLPRTKPDCDLYIFTAYQVLKEWLQVADDLSRHGFFRSALLVWEKDGPGMGDLEGWGMGHEVIIFLKKGRKPRYAPRRSGVLHISQLRPKDLIHPHEKPQALLELLIKHSTQEGEFIVDPFGGSGSLARAARACGRNAVCIEYDKMNYELATAKLESAEEALF
jgi:adenine-specific DNA-methyltransferase